MELLLLLKNAKLVAISIISVMLICLVAVSLILIIGLSRDGTTADASSQHDSQRTITVPRGRRRIRIKPNMVTHSEGQMHRLVTTKGKELVNVTHPSRTTQPESCATLGETQLFLTCDNIVRGVYQEIGGHVVNISSAGHATDGARHWGVVGKYTVHVGIPVAIECENVLQYGEIPGYAGLLASFANGKVSNSKWKCHWVLEYGWQRIDYDDTKWKNGKVLGRNGVPPWFKQEAISSNAQWIWARDVHPIKAYCRVLV